MFMIGNVGETSETVEDTIAFADRLPLDRTWFSFAAPYPGTPFYDMVEEYGEILEPDLQLVEQLMGQVETLLARLEGGEGLTPQEQVSLTEVQTLAAEALSLS